MILEHPGGGNHEVEQRSSEYGGDGASVRTGKSVSIQEDRNSSVHVLDQFVRLERPGQFVSAEAVRTNRFNLVTAFVVR